MASPSKPTLNVRSSLGLLEVIRLSGIMPLRQIEEIQSKIQKGSYPNDAQGLAARLVKKELLTSYQARHLLHGQWEGLVVGRYIILDLLGRGAMGKVYKARHRLMGRLVALKFINRQYLSRPNAVGRFIREMRLVGRLDHPNIVRAFDAEEIGRDPCIVMEYVLGQNLEQLLLGRGGLLPPGEVVCYATQVALGLAHAHERGVIHRDIKPSNLLLGDDGRLRILDLGLGTLIDDHDPDRGSVATCEGMAVGTADYMSPEQAIGREAPDGRSDLYSLGCVMYHLLTGRVPFPGDSQVECMASRIKGRPKPLADLRPGLPPGLIAVVDRLMANHRDARYATAAEVVEVLGTIPGSESSHSDAGRSGLATAAVIEGPRSISAESTLKGTPRSSGSTMECLEVPPHWWSRVLTGLSKWSPWIVLMAGLVLLLAAFATGFLFHVHVTDTLGGPSGAAIRPLSVQSVKE
jgi:serine/threonine-protein kinase